MRGVLIEGFSGMSYEMMFLLVSVALDISFFKRAFSPPLLSNIIGLNFSFVTKKALHQFAKVPVVLFSVVLTSRCRLYLPVRSILIFWGSSLADIGPLSKTLLPSAVIIKFTLFADETPTI